MTGPGVVPALLSELAQRGIKLRLADGDRLTVTAPRDGLPGELRDRISAHKRELIAWLAQPGSGPAGETGLPEIVPEPARRHEPFPPSDMQMSFLIGSAEGLEYHVRPHQYMELDFADLDPARFEQALNAALRRQRGNLVVVKDGVQLEVVADPAPVTVAVSDLRDMPGEQAQGRIEQLRAEMQRRELPLDRWPWMDVHISLYGAGRARLHYNNNNFFSDAPGTSRFLDAVMRYYRNPGEELPGLAVSYRDCVLALADLENSPKGEAARKYWCDRMAAWPDAPALPMVNAADARQRSRLERREFVFPTRLWAEAKRAGTARGLTPTAVFYGVYAEVVAYWSGSRHFLINNMITHRLPLHPQMAEVIGNFASLYPLEVDWRHDEPFEARARRLQAQLLRDMEHVYWSGVKVLQTLNQVRQTPGRAVCPLAIGSALFVGPADQPLASTLETPQVVFDCEIWDLHDGSLWVVWDVIESMFPEGLIDDMQRACRSILTQLAEDDSAWRRPAFSLLPAAQQRQRAQLNSCAPVAAPGLLHEALPDRARDMAGKPAVVSPDMTLSYGELSVRSTQIARLLQDIGIHPGDLVAVALPKSTDQIAAVLGALQAGAAYVPVDPAWPQERLGYLLTDTGAGAVITSEAGRPQFAFTSVPVLAADALACPAGPPRPVTRQPDDLAYVIYTSGSTGWPKGAMLDHRGPLNTIATINHGFGVCGADVIFGVSSLCFDLSVYDIFGTIAAGATLVLPPASQTDPAGWVDMVRASSVTVWNSVPALMDLFAEAAASAGVQLPALRLVLLSGDWIPVHLPARIRSIAPNARVISLGGATEASIWSICFPIDRQEPEWVSIPYGRPLAGQTWHVLDELGRDAPTGVAGELYIGGEGLALGYLNDPERTDAAFARHPRTGERLYRTGDRGRYLPAGDIEFLGRADFQVKIQGFRVEPGEIEHVLAGHAGVRRAAVVARSTGSGRQLAAFVSVDGGASQPDAATLRRFLAGKLPSYMIPSHITVLGQLPLTGNGKVDRRALEALSPPGKAAERTRTAPRTAAEAAIAGVWEDVLSIRPIGVHDDFFDLGGQSFAALRVIHMLTSKLGRKIPLGAMLERRTVAGLAEWLQTAELAWSPLVRLREPAGAAGDSWFFVHPAGGNVLCYQGLAELLGSPFYAFQAPGPATGQEPLADIGELAGLYLRALLDQQPHGPYLLGGWSSGAVIAAEMTHRLEQRGEAVKRLVVIDAPAPAGQRDIDDPTALLWFLEDIGIGFDPSRVPAAAQRELAARPADERLAVALALARKQGESGTGLDADALEPALAVFRGVVRACNNYRAPAIGADITVIRARDGQVSEFSEHPFRAVPDWGWGSVTGAAAEAVVLPGTHHTLLTAQHVQAVADAISGRRAAIQPGA